MGSKLSDNLVMTARILQLAMLATVGLYPLVGHLFISGASEPREPPDNFDVFAGVCAIATRWRQSWEARHHARSWPGADAYRDSAPWFASW